MTLKWAAKSPGLIVLIMITSSERLLFQVPKATDVDGIKIYDKMTRPQNYVLYILMFHTLSILIKFLISSISGDLECSK